MLQIVSINQIDPTSPRACILWHRWDVMHDTGATRYLVCRDCPARKVEQYSKGYQPIDESWVLGHSRLLDQGIGRHFKNTNAR